MAHITEKDTEKDIEKKVCKYAEEKGFLVRKYNSPGVTGVPDRILFGHGGVFLIEFKKPEGRLSAAQRREIARIRDHGAVCFVVDSVEYGGKVIDIMVGPDVK